MKQELRTLSCELRTGSGNDKMTLAGRAITYGALSAPLPTGHGDSFRERVLPFAFADSLASGSNVIADWNHDRNALPLGTTQAGTLVIKDGPEGIDFRCTLDPNQEAHRALYSSVKRGDAKFCSWTFNTDGGDEWDEATDKETGEKFTRRTVKRANLLGISIVNSPAYPGTATSVQARSAQAVLIPTRRSRHAAAFRGVPAGICLEDYAEELRMIPLRAHARRLGVVIERDRVAYEAARRSDPLSPLNEFLEQETK